MNVALLLLAQLAQTGQCMPFNPDVPGVSISYLNKGQPTDGSRFVWVYMHYRYSGRELLGYLRPDNMFCIAHEAKTDPET